MKKYTFEGIIQTMTYYHEGTISTFAKSEEEAKNKAKLEVAKKMDVSLRSVYIINLVSVE